MLGRVRWTAAREVNTGTYVQPLRWSVCGAQPALVLGGLGGNDP
ncbi:MAG: hypothetical protein ACRDYA_09065 [Egibacteraceae bacterium]